MILVLLLVLIFILSAMISGLIIMIVLMCYCCHKKQNKVPTVRHRNTAWSNPEGFHMHIYTIEMQNFAREESLMESQHDLNDIPVLPPSYETVVSPNKQVSLTEDCTDPPSYEAAVHMKNSYV